MYLLLFVVYGLLCATLFAAFRAWHRFLVHLAERHDIPTRRRIARRWYFLVGPGVGVLVVVFVLFSRAFLPRTHIVLIPVFLIPAVLPPVIWWFRRARALYSLGYGARGLQNTYPSSGANAASPPRSL